MPIEALCSADARLLLLIVGHQGCDYYMARPGTPAPRVWGRAPSGSPGTEPLVDGSQGEKLLSIWESKEDDKIALLCAFCKFISIYDC